MTLENSYEWIQKKAAAECMLESITEHASKEVL